MRIWDIFSYYAFKIYFNLRHPRIWLRWKRISLWWDGYDEGVEHGYKAGYKRGQLDAVTSVFGPRIKNGYDIPEHAVMLPPGDSDDDLPTTELPLKELGGL